MLQHQTEGLKYYSFDLFNEKELVQGIFTRHGGVSPEPWASLNTGGTVGDDRNHIIENRRRIFSAVDRAVESLFDVWQVHGVDVRCATAPRPLDQPHQEADIIMTDQPEITLFMRFADCVPIFLHDPVRHVVAMTHAGWQGTLKLASAVTVKTMQERYGCKPADIRAGIGPSIGPDHYVVGPEVVRQVHQALGERANQVLALHNGKNHLDLWEANRLILLEAGVETVQIAGLCTACHIEDWFSHRGEHGKTGRFGAVLALRN